VTVRLAGITAGVLVVLALSSCSNDSIAGHPVPSSTASTTGSSPLQPSAKPALPPRPKELTIDEINPCALFPNARRAEFGVIRLPVGPYANGGESRCSFPSSTGSVDIATDPKHGAPYFLGDKPALRGDAVTIGDYPAVSEYTKADKDRECFVRIDVADGQNLSIQYNDSSRPGPDVLCPIAQRVALVALDALKAQK